MLKAVFVDYTGTIIKEEGPDIREVIRRTYENSDIESPQAMVAYWWRLLNEYEEKSFGNSYMSEDDIVEELLKICEKEIHLKENPKELHAAFQRFWMYAPAYEDTAAFFKECPLPIYIISNNAGKYIEESMRDKDLHPAGIISSDMVRAYKPHRAVFEKALEVSGCSADEVIHIGDSVSSDVEGAKAANIQPVLVDRGGKSSLEGVLTVKSLTDIIPLINAWPADRGQYNK
ncbi:HAD family hydrolase [[Clostridium] hylemonae]|uniref:Haloacid dehalogenase-like hydrolase n=1 Tax=[Clostridium] hylemonae DSM 15053 TaxID=553973 RepID=C0C024_9FIRM|nr:HAD family hydrolase [[Clostridium] hylemonae]EEG74752.1 haloacid dehalogenase-like hydrolase [[Clostridium] hylemonae DSM 15053]QEK18767.1 Phosphoglycolate phosphatase [[Clostridium] hylemonae DSM 15053]